MEGGENTPREGWWASLRKLGATVLEMLQTRVELFGVELQEERQRFLEVVVGVVAAAFFTMMAMVVLTAAVVLASPPSSRPYVLAAFFVIYAAGSVCTVLVLRKRMRERPPPFAGTLNELKKDAASLRPES